MQILKQLLFLICTVTVHHTFSQTQFGKIKCDSFVVMKDTTRALIYKKNKTGVYDKKIEAYILKPTKSTSFYFDQQDLIVQVTKDEMTYVYLNDNGETARIQSENPNLTRAYFSTADSAINDSIMRLGAFIWNFKSGKRATIKYEDFIKYNESFIYIFRKSDGLIEVNYQTPPTLKDDGVTASGIYSSHQKKWLIPPIYAWVEELPEIEHGYIICSKRDSLIPALNVNNQTKVRAKHAYDIYERRVDGFVLAQANIAANDQLDLASIIDVDSVIVSINAEGNETNEYITYKDGKQGLIRFQLFNLPYVDPLEQSYFVYQEVLTPQYDFILNDVLGGNVFTATIGETREISLFRWVESKSEYAWNLLHFATANDVLFYGMDVENNQRFLIDGHLYTWMELAKAKENEKPVPAVVKKTIQMHNFPSDETKSCGLKWVNDSLLTVINFKNDEKANTFGYPLQSLQFPEEDSVILTSDGFYHAVFGASIPGYEKSGVFNLSTKKWLLPPTHKFVYTKKNGLITELVERSDDGSLRNATYQMFALNGKLQMNNLEDLNTSKVNPLLYGETNIISDYDYPEKSGYREDGGFEKGSWRYNGDYHAVVLESGQWQVQQPVQIHKRINPIPITKPAEFVHYNPTSDYYFWMDQDSIYLEIDEDCLAASRKNGKINIESYRSSLESDSFDAQRIYLISEGDTTILSGYTLTEGVTNLVYTSFYVQNDLLFINEQQKFDNITPNLYELNAGFEGELSEYMSFKIFETETSYCCKLIDGVWKKVTPYYANIVDLPFGYLATVGAEEILIDQYDWVMEKKERAYIILDSNFKAVSYLDFYDFSDAIIHPFGVQLRMGKHYFLLDNEGKMITSADWDEFIIENDQLKAIRYHPMTPDFNFDLKPGEEIDEIKFYPLPKF